MHSFGRVALQSLLRCAAVATTLMLLLRPSPLQAQAERIAGDSARAADAAALELSGSAIDRLPADSVEQTLLLLPGVSTTRAGALSIRGGAPGDIVTMVDGIPISGGLTLGRIPVGTNAIGRLRVLSGPLSAAYGDAQSGVIAIETPEAAARWTGAAAFESDELGLGAASRGFNRLQGIASGPLTDRLSLFVAGVAVGRRSALSGFESREAPIFVRAGVDTTVTQTVFSSGGPTTEDVPVYNFAVARGDCDAFDESTNPEIANNYGRSCEGVRIPNSGGSSYQWLGRLDYELGEGSRLSFLAMGNQDQAELFSYTDLYNPGQQWGRRRSSRVLGLTWIQRLRQSGNVTLEGRLSFQTDRVIQSPFQPGGVGTGTLGFYLKPYDFRYDFDSFPIDEELVNEYRTQTGGSGRPVDPGEAVNFVLVDRFRNNPYGLLGFSESGGPEGQLELVRENRTLGQAILNWQVSPENLIRFGGEYTVYSVAKYSHEITGPLFTDVFLEKPVRGALLAESSLRVGDATLDAGVRYDFYHTRAGRPGFVCDAAEDADDGQANGFCGPTLAVGETSLFPRTFSMPGSDIADPTAHYVDDEAHDALSPRLRLSYAVSSSTELRIGYARLAQIPRLDLMLTGINTDFSLTTGTQMFGSDLDFERSSLVELGVRQEFGNRTAVDLALYSRDIEAGVAGRIVDLYDPVTNAETDIRMLTNDLERSVKGLDLRLDHRVSPALSGSVAYSYASADIVRQDGFDSESPYEDGLVRPHTFAARLAFLLPNDDARDPSDRPRDGLVATFRYASGGGYTGCVEDSGNESVISGEVCAPLTFGGFDVNRLPAFKSLDLRASKTFEIGGRPLTVYADARNILNFRNVLAVFVNTEDVVNQADFNLDFAGDSLAYFQEAANNGVVTADGGMDLTFGGAGASGCGGWVNTSDEAAVPNCVYLIRAEQRFGDGDGIFTADEQRAASRAFYDVSRGPQAFTGVPRRVRIGVEVGF